MTSKKNPTTKQKPDWAAQLDAMEPVVGAVAFKATDAAFDHTLAPAGAGAPLAQINAKVRAAAGNGVTNVLVRVPNDTLERIKTHVVGSHTSAIVALADWALHYLEETGQTLVVREKD